MLISNMAEASSSDTKFVSGRYGRTVNFMFVGCLGCFAILIHKLVRYSLVYHFMLDMHVCGSMFGSKTLGGLVLVPVTEFFL